MGCGVRPPQGLGIKIHECRGAGGGSQLGLVLNVENPGICLHISTIGIQPASYIIKSYNNLTKGKVYCVIFLRFFAITNFLFCVSNYKTVF